MMRRKEMKQLLDERSERIGLLEQRLETLNQLVDNYQARESVIVQALSSANETAAKRVQDAQTQAQQIIDAAHAQAAETAAAAQDEAAAAIRAANDESTRLLAETKKSVHAYESALAVYNANLERSAAEVQATAARYASFIQERKIDAGELFNEIGGGAVTINPAVADELPDPGNDPKALMQNIYKLQNRDIPLGSADAEASPAPAQSDQPNADQAPDGLIDEILADLGPSPADASDPEPEWQPEQEPEPEWQPEQEPEFVPSVSELVPDASDDAVSLDALLDEIISAGDI